MNEFDSTMLLLPLVAIVAAKFGYDAGRMTAKREALNQLREIMLTIKKIGEELHARQNGQV